MTAFTSNYLGVPSSGFYSAGDTVTDTSGAVHTCVKGGYGAPTGFPGSSIAQWSSAPAPLDQMGGALLLTAQNALTAHAGGGQAAAIADPNASVTSDLARVTTVATAADSVALPASVKGREITLTNAAAANSMNVFGQVGDQINALGANTAYALAAGKTATFSCALAGQWHAVLSA